MTKIIERDITIIAADGSTEKRTITVDAATWETIEHIQDGGTLTLAVMNELHQLPTQTVNGFIAHSMHAHEEDRNLAVCHKSRMSDIDEQFGCEHDSALWTRWPENIAVQSPVGIDGTVWGGDGE